MSRTTTNRYNIHVSLLISILVCPFFLRTTGFAQNLSGEDTGVRKSITAAALSQTIDSPGTSGETDDTVVRTLEMLGSDEFVPEVIVEHRSGSPYVLLVDKSTYTLYVLKYEQGSCSPVASYDCKTGMESGDKQQQGDLKTPEGIYFFTGKLTREEIQSHVGLSLAYQYGDMAFITDYPNSIDRFRKKTGSGIWLHGTDEPFSETPPADTHGCVVTTNETIRLLEPFITPNRTPMIIVDEIRFISRNENERRKQDVLALLWGWCNAWRDEDIDLYIEYYSPDFSGNGKTFAQWKNDKASIFRTADIDRIDLSDIVVMKYRDGLVAQFGQEYMASNLKSDNVKALYLVPVGSTWKIIAETIQR